MLDRLDGIKAIIDYLGVSKADYYRHHAEAIQPYLLQRENWRRRKGKSRHRFFTFKHLVTVYLLEREIEREE